MNFDFGQPRTGIIQMAYVVADMKASISHWVDDLGVGPWFLLDRWCGEEAMYRNEPSRSVISAAMAFSGHMLIELIQPLDDEPSVYKEVIDRTGFGFHHLGVGSEDYDRDIAIYKERGQSLAYQARVPAGRRVGYIDTGGALPGFIEVIENGPEMEALFTQFYKASLRWDGQNPVRPFV